MKIFFSPWEYQKRLKSHFIIIASLKKRSDGFSALSQSGFCPAVEARVGAQARAASFLAPLNQTPPRRIALLLPACACDSNVSLLAGYI